MNDKMIFTICPDGEFFGRRKELGAILEAASDAGRPAPGLVIAGKRWTGKTELLRRAHRELFWSQARVAPVYYQFKGSLTPEEFAEDFIKEVLKQYASFRRRDPSAALVPVSIDKLERQLIDDGSTGMAEIIGRHRDLKAAGDRASMARNAADSFRVISASSLPVFLIIDDLDRASSSVAKELGAVLSARTLPYAASVQAASSLEELPPNAYTSVIALSGLDGETSVSMASELSRQGGVDFDTEILALAVRRLEGNPMYIKNIVWAAKGSGRGLLNLRDFADIYAGELSGGNISLSLSSVIRLKGLSDLRVLNSCASSQETSIEALMETLRYPRAEVERVAEELGSMGLIDVSLGSIRWAAGAVERDFIRYTHETRAKGRSHEEAKTWLIRDILKEGFDFRGEKTRGRFKDEVLSLLNGFSGQSVLKVLLRYHLFSSRYKNGEYRAAENKQEEEIALPHVTGSFDASSLEKEESGPAIIIAHGFQNNRYDSGNEVIWIAGVKEADMPVNAGDVDNFMRRASLIKEHFRPIKALRWLIGKEGFTEEAAKRLDAEGLWASSALQLGILRESLGDKDPSGRKKAPDKIAPNKEFEVMLPMSSKAELVAARAAEEIGTEMGFDEIAIQQIKTALVEACINAFEHSKVTSSKVHLRFVAGADRLVIYVQNSGADFSDFSIDKSRAPQGGTAGLPHKRGWGIELMKGMMDEVRLERLKQGARIVLVKYLIKK